MSNQYSGATSSTSSYTAPSPSRPGLRSFRSRAQPASDALPWEVRTEDDGRQYLYRYGIKDKFTGVEDPEEAARRKRESAALTRQYMEQRKAEHDRAEFVKMYGFEANLELILMYLDNWGNTMKEYFIWTQLKWELDELEQRLKSLPEAWVKELRYDPDTRKILFRTIQYHDLDLSTMLNQLPPYVVFRSVFQDIGGPYGCKVVHDMYRLSPSDNVYVAFRLEHINIWGRSG